MVKVRVCGLMLVSGFGLGMWLGLELSVRFYILVRGKFLGSR